MIRRAAIGIVATLLAASAQAQPDPRAPEVLAAVHAQLGANGFDDGARYAIVFSDLNDDHQAEAIVHLEDRNLCGSGGCTTFVLTLAGDGWHPIGRMIVSHLPVYRLPTHHNGWFDLAVRVSGGGIRPSMRAMSFSRGHYAANPTKAPVLARVPQEASLLLGPDVELSPVGAN